MINVSSNILMQSNSYRSGQLACLIAAGYDLVQPSAVLVPIIVVIMFFNRGLHAADI